MQVASTCIGSAPRLADDAPVALDSLPVLQRFTAPSAQLLPPELGATSFEPNYLSYLSAHRIEPKLPNQNVQRFG